MARPKLKSVEMLKNHGARVTYATPAQETERFERPGGFLTAAEAAMLLGVPKAQFYRMARAKRMSLRQHRNGDTRRVPLLACRILLARPRRQRGSATGGSLLAGYDARRRRVTGKP